MASLEHDIGELESNLRSATVERDALKNENAALRTSNELLGAEKLYLSARLEVEIRANEKAMTLLEMQSADLLMGLRAIKAANAARSRSLQETSMGVGGLDPSPMAPKTEAKPAPFMRAMPTVPGKPTAVYFGDGKPQNIDPGEVRIGTTYEDRETGDVWKVQADYTWVCIWFNNIATDGQRVNIDAPAPIKAKPAHEPIDFPNRVQPGRIDQTLADRDSRIPKNVMSGMNTDDDRAALGAMAENLLRQQR